MAEILTVDSTNVIEVTGLKSRVTGTYITSATVDADLYAADGTTPIGGATNLTLTLVTSTLTNNQGTSRTMYRGAIPYTVTIANGTAYVLKVTAIESGVQRVFRIACTGKNG